MVRQWPYWECHKAVPAAALIRPSTMSPRSGRARRRILPRQSVVPTSSVQPPRRAPPFFPGAGTRQSQVTMKCKSGVHGHPRTSAMPSREPMSVALAMALQPVPGSR